jgi:hypothetical protein
MHTVCNISASFVTIIICTNITLQQKEVLNCKKVHVVGSFWNDVAGVMSFIVVIPPRRWIWEGDIVLALSVLLSVSPSVCPNCFSALVLCNYWLEFNETLWEPLIPRGDAHIVGLFRSDTSTQSYGPWLVMQYAYRARIVSALLLCNYWLNLKETLWESSIPREDAHIIALFWSDTLTQSYGPWLVMQYA